MHAVARELAEAFPRLRSSANDADRLAYARDLWPRHHLDVRAGRRPGRPPAAIAWPASTEEVAALVQWANRRGATLVPFGAGSGVCAGILPDAESVVVDLKRLARLRAIDASAPVAVVEAGAMGVPLEASLNRAGWTLGHFPSSILCSTAGGWVATRSAGQCSGAYGKIEDMVLGLECVTGSGEIVRLQSRAGAPNLVPLVVGSEGTLAVVTCATFRLHPAPSSRAFGAWSFPTTKHGWEAMRDMFQAGLRPAVARVYDPFDAMLARHGRVRSEGTPSRASRAPGLGGAILRAIVRRPRAINDLLHTATAARALGGAMLVLVFEGAEGAGEDFLHEARRIAHRAGGAWEGPDPARGWFEHRYAVSYRQAPVFANGAFVDTMEVAAPWSKLEGLFEAVRRSLSRRVFVMAHLSHAYPDGCCIYFSFAGAAEPGRSHPDWDAACAATYDQAWRGALAAAVEAGGTLAHHHGVGRSKAPRLREDLGDGADVVRGLMRGFDPNRVLNPGALLDATPESPRSSRATVPADVTRRAAPRYVLDRASMLASAAGDLPVAELERRLLAEGFTLDVALLDDDLTVGEWLACGAPGARDAWLDPVDHLVAGLDATLKDGREVRVSPAPRRSVGPDLTALFLGCGGRFGGVRRAWLRVHPRGGRRPAFATLRGDRSPPLGDGERRLLDCVEQAIVAGGR